MNNEWFTENGGYFDDRYLAEYESTISEEATRHEVSFIKKVLDLPAGAAVLDMACGHGRHAVALAQQGYRMTGFDINNSFLTRARELAAAAHVAVDWVQGDMRSMVWRGSFDVVLNMFTSFGYFASAADDRRVMKGVSEALRPGGLFLLDNLNREYIVRHFVPLTWRATGEGAFTLMRREFDLIKGATKEERIRLSGEGGAEKFDFFLRRHTLTELVALGEDAGLTLVATYGGFNEQPLTLEAERCIVVFKKT